MKTIRLTENIQKAVDTLIHDFEEEIKELKEKVIIMEKVAGVTYEEFQTGRRVLSLRETNLVPADLQFNGVIGEGAHRLLYYNVLKKEHEKYKSTLCWAPNK